MDQLFRPSAMSQKPTQSGKCTYIILNAYILEYLLFPPLYPTVCVIKVCTDTLLTVLYFVTITIPTVADWVTISEEHSIYVADVTGVTACDEIVAVTERGLVVRGVYLRQTNLMSRVSKPTPAAAHSDSRHCRIFGNADLALDDRGCTWSSTMTKSDKSWICIQTSPNGPFDCLVERVTYCAVLCLPGLYIVMIISAAVSSEMEWNGNGTANEWNEWEWNRNGM
jgi:hypothetical protein